MTGLGDRHHPDLLIEIRGRSWSRGIKSGKIQLDWLDYDEPIAGQEYVAVKARLDYLETRNPEEVQDINPFWNLTLRFEKDGDDIYGVNIVDHWVEGYVPISGEGWLFFLVREGSRPYLYFHPMLVALEAAGVRTGGAYFSLDTP